MATSTIEIERRAEIEVEVRNLRIDVIGLGQRADKQDERIGRLTLAVSLSAGAFILAFVCFVLLLVLLVRPSAAAASPSAIDYRLSAMSAAPAGPAAPRIALVRGAASPIQWRLR